MRTQFEQLLPRLAGANPLRVAAHASGLPDRPADQPRPDSAGPCQIKRWAVPGVLMIALMVATSCGCVQRRLQIRSHPEGAAVSVDRQPVGLAPVSVPYTYYGTREIQLEKDGYKTVRVEQNIRPPWFDTFPISLISNHFAGRELRDDRVFDFTLEPKQAVNEELLFERANDLRSDIRQGTVTAPISR